MICYQLRDTTAHKSREALQIDSSTVLPAASYLCRKL